MKSRLSLTLLFTLAATLCHAVPGDWTTPVAPFKISGNLYYVGSRDLAAYLIVTPEGNILINSNLESSPPQSRSSVEKLGFRWRAIKILLNSQAHFDHAAGAAQILRETRAQYLIMDSDVDVIKKGGVTDYDGTLPHFPPAVVGRILHDNDTVTLGETVLTAHKTAGHTRGCTTWTMRTQEGGQTFKVVIVGGWALNPGLRLIPNHGKPVAYPGIAEDFDHTFATLKSFPCDIFLGAHGVYFDFLAKLDRLPKQGPSVWIDRDGYRQAVLEAEANYRKELASQRSASE
jgi:metallo-beta-lactamase class B